MNLTGLQRRLSGRWKYDRNYNVDCNGAFPDRDRRQRPQKTVVLWRVDFHKCRLDTIRYTQNSIPPGVFAVHLPLYFDIWPCEVGEKSP